MNATITLRDYLNKNKTFVIPTYQRGYVWGKRRGGEKDSVTNFLLDVRNRYTANTDLFLQGFTVTEKDSEIILIDGQQRTTCLYLLLKWLGYDKPFTIRYEIRKQSDACLKKDIQGILEDDDTDYQDIHFFKKTLKIIEKELGETSPKKKAIDDRQDFINYLLDHIKFLFIDIEESQAVRVFTMMNGSKAKMKHEEIIKAEILRLASKKSQNSKDFEEEWEGHMLRSRYAREWDKWLHWWFRKDVKCLYRCSGPLGLLISSYFMKNPIAQKDNIPLTFEAFRNAYLAKSLPIEAKKCFDGLRRLQKRFEDAFDDAKTHNRIGAILCVLRNEDRPKFIQYYFVDDNRKDLVLYYKLIFLGLSHDYVVQLIDALSTEQAKMDADLKDKFEKAYAYVMNAVNDDLLYRGDKEVAFRLLLRLNVDEDINQERKFNFNIWKERSLEHIFSKSTVKHQDNNTGQWLDHDNNPWDESKQAKLDRADIKTIVDGKEVATTEHSIGNLVLLYKNENSQFNNSDFNYKKILFFSPSKKDLFKSRHLLHTICVFAEKPVWDGPAIAENKAKTVKSFIEDYKTIVESVRNAK